MNQDDIEKQADFEPSLETVNRSHNEPHHSVDAHRLPKETARPLLYICLASVLLLTALFFSFIVPQTPGRMVRPSVALISDLSLWSTITSLPLPIPQGSLVVAGVLIFVIVMAFAAYGLAVYISWYRLAGRQTIALIVITSIAFFIVSTLSLPNTNTDIFNYIVNGRIAAVHNSNPYFVAADEFPDDPVYPYASKNYTGLAADKMPFWMLTNVLLAKLAGNHVTTNLIIYRMALMLFNIINLLLIAIIARKLNPHYLASALIIYGWNPIVIVHAQSKSDTLMALLLLLAVLFLIKKWRLLAVAALGLSVMVKLITLPLAAVYELRNLRLRKWRALIVDILILGVASLILIILLWQNLEIATRLIALLGVVGTSAPGVLRIILIIGFGLLILGVSAFQDGRIDKLLWAWSLVLLYFCVFLTKFGFSWYLITLLAIVGLVFDWRIVLVSSVLSFTSFLYNSWYSTFTELFSPPDLLSFPAYFVYILMTALIVTGILFFALGMKKLRQRSSDPVIS